MKERPGLGIALTTLLAPISWGTTYVVITELLPPDRPLLVATLRLLPASLALLTLGALTSPRHPPSPHPSPSTSAPPPPASPSPPLRRLPAFRRLRRSHAAPPLSLPPCAAAPPSPPVRRLSAFRRLRRSHAALSLPPSVSASPSPPVRRLSAFRRRRRSHAAPPLSLPPCASASPSPPVRRLSAFRRRRRSNASAASLLRLLGRRSPAAHAAAVTSAMDGVAVAQTTPGEPASDGAGVRAASRSAGVSQAVGIVPASEGAAGRRVSHGAEDDRPGAAAGGGGVTAASRSARGMQGAEVAPGSEDAVVTATEHGAAGAMGALVSDGAAVRRVSQGALAAPASEGVGVPLAERDAAGAAGAQAVVGSEGGVGWRGVGGEWGRTAVLAVFNFGLFFPLLVVAVYRLPGGVAAAVGGLQPLLVATVAWLVDGRRPARRELAVGVAAAVGVALVVLRPGAAFDTVGLLAAAGANASFAVGVVLTKRFPTPANRVTATGWQLLLGGVVLLPLTLAIEGLPPSVDGWAVAGFAYLSLGATALAFVLWFNGVRRLPTAAPPLLGLAAPVTGATLGWVILGQSLSPLQLTGFAVTLSAIGYGATLGSPGPTITSGEKPGTRSSRPSPARIAASAAFSARR